MPRAHRVQDPVDETRDYERARRGGYAGRGLQVTHSARHVLSKPMLFKEEPGPCAINEFGDQRRLACWLRSDARLHAANDTEWRFCGGRMLFGSRDRSGKRGNQNCNHDEGWPGPIEGTRFGSD